MHTADYMSVAVLNNNRLFPFSVTNNFWSETTEGRLSGMFSVPDTNAAQSHEQFLPVAC